MAAREITAPAHYRLRKTEYTWGDAFTGSPEDIVAAGLVKLEHLPGQPGMGKTSVTLYEGSPVRKGTSHPRDDRYRHILRLNAKKFRVKVGMSVSESERRREASEKQEQTARDTREAKEQANRSLESMLTDSDQFQERSVLELQLYLRLFRGHCMEPSEFHGFFFDDATIRRFNMLFESLIELIANGRIVFDEQRHQAIVAKLQSVLDGADSPAAPKGSHLQLAWSRAKNAREEAEVSHA
jgi:hypothetical protein